MTHDESRALPDAGFVSALTAAGYFNLTSKTWCRLSRLGKVPAGRHIGAAVRWNVVDLRDFAAGRWVPSTKAE